MQILLSLAGMVLILLIAFLLSSNRKAIRPRVVLSAFALQAGVGRLGLHVSSGQRGSQGPPPGAPQPKQW